MRRVATRRRNRSGSAASTLVTTSLSAVSICRRPRLFVSDLSGPMQGVDRHDNLTHHDVVLQDGICDDGVEDGGPGRQARWFRARCGRFSARRISPHPIVADLAKQRHERWAFSQQAQPPARTRSRVEPPAARHRPARRGFVDHHQGVLQQAMVKMMAQPGALAGAKKAAENREPHPAFARIARQGVGASSAKRGSSGSTGRPVMRSAASQSSLRVLTIT